MLDPGENLSDKMVDLILAQWLDQQNEETRECVHLVFAGDYQCLHNDNFELVHKSFSKVALFNKKYVLWPVNIRFHWSLAVIVRPDLFKVILFTCIFLILLLTGLYINLISAG